MSHLHNTLSFQLSCNDTNKVNESYVVEASRVSLKLREVYENELTECLRVTVVRA